MNYMYMYIYVLNPTYTKNEEEEVVKKVSGTIKTRLRWKDLYFLRMSQGYLNKLCAKKPFVDECKAGAKQIYMKVKAALQDAVSYKIQHQNELIQIEKASSWEDVMDGIIRVLTIDDFDQKEHNDNMFDELITDNWIVKKSMQEFINSQYKRFNISDRTSFAVKIDQKKAQLLSDLYYAILGYAALFPDI